MKGRVRNWAAAILGIVALSGLACQSAGSGAGGAQEQSPGSDGVKASPTEFYAPTGREWTQYLSRMESWMNEDAKAKLAASGSTKDAVQVVRSAFNFEPGFDQPMPAFDAPPDWNCSYLILTNTNDEAVKVSISGVPFGTLKSGQRYILPVRPYTRYVIEYYVTEHDLYRQRANPLRLLVRFTRDVK